MARSIISLCLPGYPDIQYNTVCCLTAGPQLPAPRPRLSERLSNVTADRSGACRQSYHATTDLEMERSDVHVLPRASPSSPHPTGGVSGRAKKFQAHAWEASALGEHETPKLRAGRSLAPGRLGGGAAPGSRFGQRCCSLLSVVGAIRTAHIHTVLTVCAWTD